MLLTEIYYAAGEIEHRAAGRPSRASLYQPKAHTPHATGPRRILGRALIDLGRAISAERNPAT